MLAQLERESRAADAALHAFTKLHPGDRGATFRRLLRAAQDAYARQTAVPLDS